MHMAQNAGNGATAGMMGLAAPWLRGLTYPFLCDDLGMIAENPF